MVHHAKVDWWVPVLFGAGFLLQIVVGAMLIGAGLFPFVLIPVGAGVLMGLLLWTSSRTRYEVTSSDLIIRFGPFRTTLPAASIVAIFPTRNPVSAPAPSLDRLRIDYRKNGELRFTLISPRDKEAFVRDLAQAAPQMRITI
jgi:hypothetical protein